MQLVTWLPEMVVLPGGNVSLVYVVLNLRPFLLSEEQSDSAPSADSIAVMQRNARVASGRRDADQRPVGPSPPPPSWGRGPGWGRRGGPGYNCRMTKKPLDIESLVRILGVAGGSGAYDISPDGQQAAVVWEKSGHAEIWLVPTDGGDQPRQITSDPESKAAPKFSPDGRTLAFTQDYGGDENYDIFLHDLASGRVRNLTPDTPDETINPEVSWSPDGQRLAFVSNRGGQMAAHVLDLATGAVRRATEHSYADYTVEWSPDGCRLAVNAHTTGQDVGAFIVPADGASAERAVGDGKGMIDAVFPRWSPDSRRILFSSNAHGVSDVGIYDLDSGTIGWVTEGPWDKVLTDWSPDGRRIVYTFNRGGDVALVVKDLETGETQAHEIEPGVHLAPRFSRDGRHIFFLYAGPRRPNDLWALSLTDGTFRPLTQSLPPEFSPDDFVAPEMVQWQSDEWTVHGVLYRPAVTPSSPLPAGIVLVHGGPTWQWHNDWSVVIQHLVSHGFVVLSVNYRGSTGYGKAYQEANRFDLGGGDMRDVIRGAEFLEREGIADPKRLGITGVSYGGYLTMTALTRYPLVFAAGSAVVPFLNWFTEHASEREDLQYWDEQNFGDPVKDAGRYRELSPIFFMDNVVAPAQMLAGENDPRCPPDEARQAADALAKLGRPHELVIYPGEGHGFAKVENRIDAYRRRAEFLIKYLK